MLKRWLKINRLSELPKSIRNYKDYRADTLWVSRMFVNEADCSYVLEFVGGERHVWKLVGEKWVLVYRHVPVADTDMPQYAELLSLIRASTGVNFKIRILEGLELHIDGYLSVKDLQVISTQIKAFTDAGRS